MRYLAMLFALLALVVFGLYGYGRHLPKQHTVSVSAVYSQPVEKVWERISDFGQMPQWLPEVARVEQVEDRNGFPVWRLYPEKGEPMDIELVRADKPRLHISKIVDSDQLPYGGTWAFQLKPLGDAATEVTLTENGYIKTPLMRVFFTYAVGYDAMIKKHLMELGASFGEKTEATP